MKCVATLAGAFLSFSVMAQHSSLPFPVRPMTEKRADFFSNLHLLVRLPDVKPDDVSVDARIKQPVNVWSYNPSSECTFDNHHQVCKSKFLYLLVSSYSEIELGQGVELGPSFGWELTAIELQESAIPCVLFKLDERVLVRGRSGAQMQIVKREICLSERGLVRR